MPSRADVARIAGSRRVRAAGIRIAGYNRLGRDLRSVIPPSMFVDAAGALPPARRATEAEAMGLPPFGRAVALIANAVASTEWYARRWNREDRRWERLDDDPNILVDPYPLSTIWNVKWGMAEDLIKHGNVIALNGDLDWRTGRPGWIVPIAADTAWVYTDPARPGWYQWAIGGELFDPDEIFHVSAGAGSGEILGRGVLEQYGLALDGHVEAEQFSRDTFAAGALPPAVISAKGAATQEQADSIKAKWREVVSSREPVVFPDGTTLHPVVSKASEQQLVEARTWNAQQAAYVVGVSSWKLGLPGPTMTYQNVETADIDFVRDDVDRWARPIVEAMTKWLMPHGTDVEWDYESRMRSDAKTRADVDKVLVDGGIKTRDEIRRDRNLPPLPQDPTIDEGGEPA